MGIKGVYPFIKKKLETFRPGNHKFTPPFQELPLKNFSGRKIAIDAPTWMYVNMSSINTRESQNVNFLKGEELNRNKVVTEWMKSCLNFLNTWLDHGLIPIMIFDGKFPEEKKATQTGRIEKRQLVKDEIVSLKDILRSGIKSAPDLGPKVSQKRDYSTMSMDQVADRLRKISATNVFVSREDILKLQSILTNIGIPVMVAPTEAEKLCSYLIKFGHCDLVFTTDSDATTYGAEKIINKIYAKSDGNHYVSLINLSGILRVLDLTYLEYVDLCILCGTDYNDNIPGIGPAKSYDLLRKYKTIERIESSGLNCDILKYKVSRKLFTHTEYIIDDEELNLNSKVFLEFGYNKLKEFSLEEWYPKLERNMSPETCDIMSYFK